MEHDGWRVHIVERTLTIDNKPLVERAKAAKQWPLPEYQKLIIRTKTLTEILNRIDILPKEANRG